MIFLTIGTQEPFDRLVKTVDEIAANFPQIRFVAQISKTDYLVKNMETMQFLSPSDFEKFFIEASLIVSHAGMGTIISALEKKKPIIVMPRIAKLGEHRNEHQLATANKMDALNYVRVAYSEDELKSKMIPLLEKDQVLPLHTLGRYASDQLIGSLKDYFLQVNS